MFDAATGTLALKCLRNKAADDKAAPILKKVAEWTNCHSASPKQMSVIGIYRQLNGATSL